MKITRVMFFRGTLPFISPLRVGTELLEARETSFMILCAGGDSALGEAAAPLGSSHEIIDGSLSDMQALAHRLMELELPDDCAALDGSLDALSSVTNSPSIRCGLEMALLNLAAARVGKSLAQLLSPTASREVSVNALITDINSAVDEATRFVQDGYRTLKLKVGRADLELEATTVRAVRAAIGDDIALRLDANRAWALNQALRFTEIIRDLKVEYIEEPCRSLDETTRLMQACHLPVAYDESLAGLDLPAVRKLPTPAAFVLKPTLLGGFERCAVLARIAQEQGARVVISSYYESSVGIGALAQFAAAYGTDGVAHGLDTLSNFVYDATGVPIRIIDGRISLEHARQAASAMDGDRVVLCGDISADSGESQSRVLCPVWMGVIGHRNEDAIVLANASLSYDQLNSDVIRWARFLTSHNVSTGTRVAVVESNRLETVILLWALWRIGAVATLVDPRLPAKTIAANLALAHTYICVKFASGSACPDLPVDTITMPPLEVMYSEPTEDITIDLSHDATVIFTSGSSGPPKAVVHTIANHYLNAASWQAQLGLTRGDRWLLSLPLFHVGGLAILWRCAHVRAAVVLADPGDNLAELALAHRVTHLSVVPTQLERILRREDALPDLRRQLKAVLLGGAPASQRLIERARGAGLPVYTSYGSTEMASQIATGTPLHPTRPKVIPGRQLRIEPDGEILVKGSSLFRGYLTEESITFEADAGGWFHTGDIGRLEPDHTLTVLGRKDNMFISGGENIHPEQIEAALGRIDGITQAVVVPIDDTEFGQRPVAFVRYDYDWMLEDAEEYPVGETAIKKKLEATLPRFMLPAVFYPWPESYQPVGLKADRAFFRDLVRKLRRPRDGRS